jgi:quinol monooxygenase YgiN
VLRQDEDIPFAAFAAPIQEVSMFIAIVDFSIAPADRAAALGHLDAERDQVRSMPGNLAFRVYASRQDEGRVAIVHEWEDEASFGAYQKSGSFARIGEAVRPMMVEPPVSRRFRAEMVETVG